jgi:bacteriocin-like protein
MSPPAIGYPRERDMTKSSLRDQLTMATDDTKIELTEQELSRISGGRGKTSEKPLEYLKITMKDIIVT